MNKDEPLYARIDNELYWETGCMRIVSNIPFSEEQIAGIIGSAPKGGFSITREKDLADCFRKIRGKMGLLVAYLIENRDANNIIPYDLKDITEKTGLTDPSVISNLRFFEKEGIIARKRKRIMLASGIVHKGNRKKEWKLIDEFKKMQESSKEGKDAEDERRTEDTE